MAKRRVRRYVGMVIVAVAAVVSLLQHESLWQQAAPGGREPEVTETREIPTPAGTAVSALEMLEVKGRAPKTNYARTQFGDGWAKVGGCDMRNIILKRDMSQVEEADCKVTKGVLQDPYTGTTMHFVRGPQSSQEVQIDHVVALSDAWQKGAQALTRERRVELSNDPLNLLAVNGEANQKKSDGDAATWLPEYKPFRCQYVARQIAVKKKYELWVTQAERDAITRVLLACPGQQLPVE